MTCFKIIDNNKRQNLIAAREREAPRIMLRVDHALVKRVIKARRDLCVGESFRSAE